MINFSVCYVIGCRWLLPQEVFTATRAWCYFLLESLSTYRTYLRESCFHINLELYGRVTICSHVTLEPSVVESVWNLRGCVILEPSVSSSPGVLGWRDHRKNKLAKKISLRSKTLFSRRSSRDTATLIFDSETTTSCLCFHATVTIVARLFSTLFPFFLLPLITPHTPLHSHIHFVWPFAPRCTVYRYPTYLAAFVVSVICVSLCAFLVLSMLVYNVISLMRSISFFIVFALFPSFNSLGRRYIRSYLHYLFAYSTLRSLVVCRVQKNKCGLTFLPPSCLILSSTPSHRSPSSYSNIFRKLLALSTNSFVGYKLFKWEHSIWNNLFNWKEYLKCRFQKMVVTWRRWGHYEVDDVAQWSPWYANTWSIRDHYPPSHTTISLCHESCSVQLSRYYIFFHLVRWTFKVG